MSEDFEDDSAYFIAAGISSVTAILLFLFSVYLSGRLGKRAWNTTSKRFSRVLEIVNVLPYLLPPKIVFGEMGYSGSCVFLSPIVYLLYLVSTFCITISATALMLQVMFPWLSERKKRWLQSNAVTKCKLRDYCCNNDCCLQYLLDNIKYLV